MSETQMPLRTIRLAQGRRLRDVARLAGISPSSLSEIERGEREPGARTLRAICAALGLKDAVKLLDALVPERPSGRRRVAGPGPPHPGPATRPP